MKRKITLPTTGGDGTLVNDFNFDGYNAIMWYSHRSDGDFNLPGHFNNHVTDSFLYWGGPAGFNPDNTLKIPGRGAHFRHSTDEIGNVYNRGYLFDYISSAYNCKGKRPMWLDWVAEEPFRNSVKCQVRVAATKDALEKAAWMGPTGEGTYYTMHRSSLKSLPKGSWMQYRAVLDTYNGVYSPILKAVEIAFE